MCVRSQHRGISNNGTSACAWFVRVCHGWGSSKSTQHANLSAAVSSPGHRLCVPMYGRDILDERSRAGEALPVTEQELADITGGALGRRSRGAEGLRGCQMPADGSTFVCCDTGSLAFPLPFTLAVGGERSLRDCFRLFDVIHAVTTTHAAISRIAAEVVRDFAADRVVYLELRTTPKARAEEAH